MFYAFLPPGSGSASVHADPDPGGISLCGSVRNRVGIEWLSLVTVQSDLRSWSIPVKGISYMPPVRNSVVLYTFA